MKYLFPVCALVVTTSFAWAQVGQFEFSSDIGKSKNPGEVTYNPANQEYSLSGSGSGIWLNRDNLHYVFNKITGDFIITANFLFEENDAEPHRKVGFMLRSSEAEDASHVSASVHGNGLAVMQWRLLKGAHIRDPQDELLGPKSGYEILQLERSGSKVIMRAAHPGEELQLIGKGDFPELPSDALLGLFISSNENVIEKAKVWNVRIDKPVSENYSTSQNGFLGCRLETVDVFTGKRNVIYEKDDRFEAPNWMPDGKELLFNMEGSLYKIPVDGGELVKLNTGFANRNNNDHGISFDGKLLAISHQRDGLPGGGSTVYVLPVEGGAPELITENTPSYWHGWAPNNQEVLYVAMREGSRFFHLYKANINTKKETQLTFFENSHVDGPEYSPDGKWIYYNGSQSGTMQLWRMKPDGTGHEQLTFDRYNDWFPHISPDGKWIAFISFPDTINPNSHPSYKRVMLRLMPVSGIGAPRVIAYLYGGQGTINVPSWSPDSRKVAFVSNSGK